MPHSESTSIVAEAVIAGGSAIREGAVASSGPCLPPRITFIADIVTPYMAAVLRALDPLCRLTPLFCARRGSRGLDWDDVALPQRTRLVGGWVLRSRDGLRPDYYPSPRLLLALAATRPQVVFSSGYSFPSLYAGCYARLSGCKFIVYCDGTSQSEHDINALQRASRRLLRRLSHGAAGKSAAAADRLIELGWPHERVFLAPHSTELAPFLAVGERRAQAPSRSLTLLSVGRLIPKKGTHLLIAAAEQARARGVDVRLSIAGSGPDEAALQAQARLAGVPVQWHGFVDQHDLPDLYAAADAFAFPSLRDPFGVVLLEAAAAGLPLIASPHAGATGELVEGHGSGVVVDPQDTARFADAIVRLATCPTERERMGRCAHALARERTPDATARRYLHAAEAVLGRPAHR